MQLPWRIIPELNSLAAADRERLWHLASRRPFDARDPVGSLILVAGLIISGVMCFLLLHSIDNVLLKLAIVPAYVFIDFQIAKEVTIRRFRNLIRANR
jgi:hypothetical protein